MISVGYPTRRRWTPRASSPPRRGPARRPCLDRERQVPRHVPRDLQPACTPDTPIDRPWLWMRFSGRSHESPISPVESPESVSCPYAMAMRPTTSARACTVTPASAGEAKSGKSSHSIRAASTPRECCAGRWSRLSAKKGAWLSARSRYETRRPLIGVIGSARMRRAR